MVFRIAKLIARGMLRITVVAKVCVTPEVLGDALSIVPQSNGEIVFTYSIQGHF
jgi:hypothetical protein